MPDEVTSVGRMIQFPPLPEIPELPPRQARSRSIEAAFIGSEEQAAELLAPLRELGPEMDTFATIGPPDLLACTWTPRGRCPGIGDHQMLADLDAESLAALVEAVGPGTGSPLLSFEFRHLGGALGRGRRTAARSARSSGEFMTFARRDAAGARDGGAAARPRSRRPARRSTSSTTATAT